MTTVHENNILGDPKHVDALQQIPSEQANSLQPLDHHTMMKPEQMDTQVTDSQPLEDQLHSDYVGSQLAHPQPLGEEDLYSDHPSSELMQSQPMSSEHMYSQPMSTEEQIHSQQANAELLHLESISAKLVHSQPISSEMMYSQPANYELAHMSHEIMNPVELNPVTVEIGSPHSLGSQPGGMELVTAQPLATDPANQHLATPQTQLGKRRNKKSIVWEHFIVETVSPGVRRAFCKVCKRSFAYSTNSKVAGTSHLKRHIAKGSCPDILREQERNQLSLYIPKSGGTDNRVAVTKPQKRRQRSPSTPYVAFDQERCRHEIARMIIMHDYPLHMVEHPGFVSFVQNLQPHFDMVSFSIVQGDCVATFLREKQILQKFIEGIPGKICLALDVLSSSYSTGYVLVTGQFIDDENKLHRRLLNVVMEPFHESDAALSHAVETCLSDWGLNSKLASITFNQPLSETALENLRALVSLKNPMLLDGQLLVQSCLARTLSSMAKEVLMAGRETIKKIRESVKYVKTSEFHEHQFLELKQRLQVPTKRILSLDNITKWNTTYEMLAAASDLKEVFSCLDTSDPGYKDAPTPEDWKEVENIRNFLKLVYDTASLMTAKNTPSSNMFFHEIWKIVLELARAAASDDLFVSGLAKPLQEKFHKYWKNSCLILALSVAMDPRFKMKLVEFSFGKIFGEDAPVYIRVVDEGIHELFDEYMTNPLPGYKENGIVGNMKSHDHQQGGNQVANNGLADFDMYIMETTSQQMKLELDQYLEESLLPRVQDFDVLGWWKLNNLKYPTLSKMARDVLSIPLWTVPRDSVFDTDPKETDAYRCLLRPTTTEALICTKDWLQQQEPLQESNKS